MLDRASSGGVSTVACGRALPSASRRPQIDQFRELAHDLKNLLAIVSSAASLTMHGELAEDKTRHFAGAMSEAAMRASKLTNQMMNMVEGFGSDATFFDVRASIVAAANLLGLLSGPEIELSVDLTIPTSTVHADRHQFDAAIVNLVSNARDAIGGKGRISVAAKSVEHSALRYVAVAVSDTGCGIPAEQLNEIFAPYFTTKGARGTGLGLSQVARFAHAAGGGVTVRSTLGSGSTFILFLPLADFAVGPDTRTIHADIFSDEVASRLD